MNINIGKAEKNFLKYTENYDLENDNIKRKQQHSLRVMQISTQIAKGLKLSEEEINLATLIGLLHDIARFEQYTQYKTYRDVDSIDHGDYGVQILEKDMRKYIETDQYDEIIKKAIKNHNKYQIEEGLNKTEEMYAKIIRDADKIDIFYESVDMFWKGRENIIEESKISDDTVEQFQNKTTIKRKREKRVGYEINEIITVIAFIFDMNYKISFEIIKKEDYINKILDRYKIKDEDTRIKVEKIREMANKYLEEKIK